MLFDPMTVTLTSEQEKFIKEQVRRGHFESVDDIIAQSLGMLRAQEEFIRSSENELREQIAIGLDQIQRGEIIDAREAIRKTRAKLQSRKPSGK